MAMSEKDENALNPFRHLWRVDDKEWLAERKEQWLELEEKSEDETKKHKKSLERYFVYGEKLEYISEPLVYLFTPYDSPETAKTLFESDLFRHHQERANLLMRYINSASKWGEGMPWLRQHIQNYVEGVLGKEYRVIEQDSGRRPQAISPEPTFWCKQFIHNSVKILQGKKQYHGCVECVDYFVSALAHAANPKTRQRCKLTEMMQQVDEVLAQSDASLLAREFAENLKAHEQQIMSNWALSGKY